MRKGRFHKNLKTESRVVSEKWKISQDRYSVKDNDGLSQANPFLTKPLIKMNKMKYSRDAPKKTRGNRCKADKYSSQNLTSSKNKPETHYISICKESCPIPFDLQTEFDKRFEINSQAQKDMNKSCTEESNFGKALFVEIPSKEDPTMIDSKYLIDISESLDESKINKLPESDTKSHHSNYKLYFDQEANKSIAKQGKSELLKRWKSEIKDDDFDTIIIEEYNTDMRNIRETNFTSKPKLTKASSMIQNTFSSVSLSTLDQKFSYHDSEHEIWNELEFIITDEPDCSFMKSDKNSRLSDGKEIVL